MARACSFAPSWTPAVLLGAAVLLAAACKQKSEESASEPAVARAVANPYTQEKCKDLAGSNLVDLKDAVFEDKNNPRATRALRVWKRYHRYSWDYLRTTGTFLGVLSRTDRKADPAYNIVAGDGFTCAWVRVQGGTGVVGGKQDVVLVNASGGLEVRDLFLAMVKPHGDAADGHWDLDEHHMPGVVGFVTGPIRDSLEGEITMRGWREMDSITRAAAITRWLSGASAALVEPGPWFPCSQFGCCKVQGQ